VIGLGYYPHNSTLPLLLFDPTKNKMFKTALSSMPVDVKVGGPKKLAEKDSSSKQPAGLIKVPSPAQPPVAPSGIT